MTLLDTQPQTSCDVISPLLEDEFTLTEGPLGIGIVEANDLLTGRVVDRLTGRVGGAACSEMLTIAFNGGAASGKSSLTEYVVNSLSEEGIVTATISSDDYVLYSREERHVRERTDPDFDTLNKYDFKQLRSDVSGMRRGMPMSVPVINAHTGRAIDGGESRVIDGGVEVLVVEGDIDPFLTDAESSELQPHLRWYLHTPDDERLTRRVNRDGVERDTESCGVIDSFQRRQQTQHFPHTLPIAQLADTILVSRDFEPPQATGNPAYAIYDRTA